MTPPNTLQQKKLPTFGGRLYNGDFGAVTAPLAIIGLLLCLLATLTSPINKTMSVFDLVCRGKMGEGIDVKDVSTTSDQRVSYGL